MTRKISVLAYRHVESPRPRRAPGRAVATAIAGALLAAATACGNVAGSSETAGLPGSTAGTTAPVTTSTTAVPTTVARTTVAPTTAAPPTAPVTAAATTAPPTTAVKVTTVPPAPSRPPRPAPPKAGRPAPPGAIGLLGPPAAPNEGLWDPLGSAVDGAPAMYSTVLRTTLDGSNMAALVWIDTSAVKGQLFAGTVQPAGEWSMPSHIPAELLPNLLASFNSGFLLNECEGGFFLDGKEGVALRDGTAGVHIDVDGTMSVGLLGRDFVLGPNTASIRQNLPLLVDNGQVAGSATDRDTHVWGKTLGRTPYVWRSGLGQRDDGTLVYVAAPAISPRTLGNLLVAGGAVRALELDINPNWVTFNIHGFDPARGQPSAAKLLPNMLRSPERYLSADDRDFFALLARPLAPPASAAPAGAPKPA